MVVCVEECGVRAVLGCGGGGGVPRSDIVESLREESEMGEENGVLRSWRGWGRTGVRREEG